MVNKYEMTLNDNILYAKRNIVDYIWKSARLEGINVTFPQTYAIYEKAQVSNVSVDDILKISNLKRAWQLLFAKIEDVTSLELMCELHAEIARDEALSWGQLRTGTVYVTGTDYMPPVPDINTTKEQLSEILTTENATERSIGIMLWGMKKQLFWDGNKRVSMMLANHEMIKNGCGIISVPTQKLQEFNELLCDYYTNDTFEAIKSFVYENCLDGINSVPNKNVSEQQTIIPPPSRGRSI